MLRRQRSTERARPQLRGPRPIENFGETDGFDKGHDSLQEFSIRMVSLQYSLPYHFHNFDDSICCLGVPEGNSGEGVTPTQTGKPGKVAVRSDPFRPRFDGQRGEVGVAHQISFGSHCLAQSRENFPVARSWRNNDTTFVIAQFLREIEGQINGRRFGINLGVCCDPNHSRKRQLGKPANFFGIQSLLQPRQIAGVIDRIRPVRVHKNVNVDEDH